MNVNYFAFYNIDDSHPKNREFVWSFFTNRRGAFWAVMGGQFNLYRLTTKLNIS